MEKSFNQTVFCTFCFWTINKSFGEKCFFHSFFSPTQKQMFQRAIKHTEKNNTETCLLWIEPPCWQYSFFAPYLSVFRATFDPTECYVYRLLYNGLTQPLLMSTEDKRNFRQFFFPPAFAPSCACTVPIVLAIYMCSMLSTVLSTLCVFGIFYFNFPFIFGIVHTDCCSYYNFVFILFINAPLVASVRVMCMCVFWL